MYIPQCIRPVSAAISVHPDLPIPATSPTDRVAAASRSSGAPRCGLVPGKPCRTTQPASASRDPLPVPRTHPVGPVRLAAGSLAANLARLVALGLTAPVRSQARG